MKDCENLPLFKFIVAQLAGEKPPTEPETSPDPNPAGPAPGLSPETADPSYLQTGVGVAGALLCGYKTYQEACKYFQQKNNKSQEEQFSPKRLLGYATATAASVAFTVYSL